MENDPSFGEMGDGLLLAMSTSGEAFVQSGHLGQIPIFGEIESFTQIEMSRKRGSVLSIPFRLTVTPVLSSDQRFIPCSP